MCLFCRWWAWVKQERQQKWWESKGKVSLCSWPHSLALADIADMTSVSYDDIYLKRGLLFKLCMLGDELHSIWQKAAGLNMQTISLISNASCNMTWILLGHSLSCRTIVNRSGKLISDCPDKKRLDLLDSHADLKSKPWLVRVPLWWICAPHHLQGWLKTWVCSIQLLSARETRPKT